MELVEKVVLKELGFDNVCLKEIMHSTPHVAPLVWIMQREMLGISIKYISEYYSESMNFITNEIYDAYKELSKDKKATNRYRTIRSRLSKRI